MNTPHPDVVPAGDPPPQRRAQPPPGGTNLGSAKFFCTMVLTFVAALNMTAISASLSPLLGMMALLVTMLVTVAVLDRLGERWTPAAVHAFDSWCRAAVRHIRAE